MRGVELHWLNKEWQQESLLLVLSLLACNGGSRDVNRKPNASINKQSKNYWDQYQKSLTL